MHRIDASGATAANKFTDGNPSTGTPATVVDAAFLNAVQEAIAYMVEAAGLVLTKGDDSQLFKAIVVKGIQSNVFNASAAGGAADAITGAYNPAPSALTDGMTFYVWAATTNATTTPTFTPNSGTVAAKTIVKGAGTALEVGDIGGWAEFQYSASLDKWVLQNPARGVKTNSKIQSVGATVAANALTVALMPTSLDFRASTLTNGATNTRDVAAKLSLVVPSGATLGTVAATQARLVILALDNAGTVELGICNLAGGLSLDETGLISTTAISASATAANVIYSTTARANVPFRVVGFLDITEATAGTWASAPTLVQGVGGQALAALSSLGYQQWTTQTGTRAIGTTYYNTTGRPIFVTIVVQLASAVGNGVRLRVNGSEVCNFYSQATGTPYGTVSAIVPPFSAYLAENAFGANTLIGWNELR